MINKLTAARLVPRAIAGTCSWGSWPLGKRMANAGVTSSELSARGSGLKSV